MSEQRPQVEIQLNPARLAHIINAAVIECNEIVNFHFNALATANLAEPALGAQGRFRVNGPVLTADDRRKLHESWIIAKAFQELLRAIRYSVEEAHIFVTLLTKKHRLKSSTTLADFLAPIRRKASALSFPKLLDAVNRELGPKIEFSAAYRSLQMARNCLEHRAGIVSKIETHGQDRFMLHVPRAKIFYLKHGEEIELAPGHIVEPENNEAQVQIMMRIATRERSFSLGDRISFTLEQFNEITFACWHLGQQLSTKLPKPI
jgi:hypothetical protein